MTRDEWVDQMVKRVLQPEGEKEAEGKAPDRPNPEELRQGPVVDMAGQRRRHRRLQKVTA